MRGFLPALAAALLGGTILSGTALAVETPKPCGPDPNEARERCIAYRPGQIVHLSATPGATMDIEFPLTEKIQYIGVSDDQIIQGRNPSAARVASGQDGTGDPNLMTWVPGAPDAAENYVTLKPLHPLKTQPLLILTWWTDPVSGRRLPRRHVFELEAASGDLSAAAQNTFFSVRFTDPDGERAVRWARYKAERAAAEAMVASDRLATASLSTTRLNKNYDGMGTPEDRAALAPSRMWDDGERTYLEYPGNRRPPNIWQVFPDGKGGEKESIVGQSTQIDPTTHGNILKVETLAPMFRLRDGDNVLCLINRQYNSVGRNTGTGTVDPGVVRQTRTPPNV